MSKINNFTIALPKGRILDVILPMLSKVGIEPEESFFDIKIRKLKFNFIKNFGPWCLLSMYIVHTSKTSYCLQLMKVSTQT